MGKVSIRFHSDIENFGLPLFKVLQSIADQTEGLCDHILGDPDIMEKHYKQIIIYNAQFQGELKQLRDSLSEISDG